MAHRLDPLLRPRSVAVLGATERPGSVGRQTMENLLLGRFPGNLYAVNPGRSDVLDIPCFPDLAALPETVDHVIVCLGAARIEGALDAIAAHGASAATIFAALFLEDDEPPLLSDRVAARIRETGLMVCGANGMGYYNLHDGIWACGFDTRPNHVRGGNVALISHSGAGMSGIMDCEERIDFNLAVSTGQELNIGMHDYLDFALDLPGTRAVGLFMETARDPSALIAAFEKARDLGIPIVALKVGRTELAARLTVSHSGAIAGRDDSYQAVFDRYGVQRVHDMDEMATTLMMFAQPHPVGCGALAAIHDSGGERQLLIDLAADMGVPIARIGADTTRRLEALLDPGLPPVNPLDAWGAGGPDADRIMEQALAALMQDPATAFAAVIHDRAPMGKILPPYIDYMRVGHAASGKPVFLVSNRQGSGHDPAAIEVSREGFPVMDGVRSFLAGARCLMRWRDFLTRPEQALPGPDPEKVAYWRQVLSQGQTLDELRSIQLLRDFGLPVNEYRRVDSKEAAVAAATDIGFPVVLKSLQPGLTHKTDHDGVLLSIHSADALEAAYERMSAALGAEAAVTAMIDEPGTEMLLGMIRDEQFGPVVLLGFGGINVQSLKDVRYAIAPFDAAQAHRLTDELKLRALLDARRDRAEARLDSWCEAASAFSVMVHALADVLQEVDVNPLIVTSERCVAVDALVVGRATEETD